jgi:hypothetical protein
VRNRARRSLVPLVAFGVIASACSEETRDRIEGSTGAAGLPGDAGPTGASAGDDDEQIVAAATSSSSDNSSRIWIVGIAGLAGVGLFMWWRTRRWRSGSPPSSG